jgi:hypothetical protein
VRTLGGYFLLVLAVASLLGPAFMLFGLAIGLDVRITEPPPFFVAGILFTVGTFWGAKRLLTAGHSR